MEDKSFLFLCIALAAVLLLSLIVLVKSETYSECLNLCEAKYKLNIDSSWMVCEDRCWERFKSE